MRLRSAGSCLGYLAGTTVAHPRNRRGIEWGGREGGMLAGSDMAGHSGMCASACYAGHES